MQAKTTKRRKIRGGLLDRNGTWYARWSSNGKSYMVSTGVKVGEKGSKEAARAVLEEKLAPFKIKSDADRKAAFANRAAEAEGAVDVIRAAEDAEKARIPLADAWKEHPYEWSQPKKPDSPIHRLSPRNVRENECAWERFVSWVKETHGTGLAMQDVTPAMAQAYADSLKAEGLTASRHNLLLTVAGVMYRLAGVPSPFVAVKKLKPQAAESREPFTREQVKRLLAAASGEWKGFLSTLYFTGLRAGDAVQLKAEQRDRAKGKLRVLTSKTGAKVEQLENPELTAILEEVAPKVKKGFLFPKLAQDYQRNPAGLSQRFTRYVARLLGETEETEEGARFEAFETTAERVGGKRRISRYGLHSMRHSFASHAAERGVPLAVVQKYLGHASEAITQIYANHATDEAARELVAAVRLDDEKEDADPAPAPAPAPIDAATLAAMLAGADAGTLEKVAELLKKGGEK